MGYPKIQPTRTLLTTIVLVMLVMAAAVFVYFSIPDYLDPLYIKIRLKCETCAKGKMAAMEDFKRGNYQVIAWGLIDSDSPTLKMATILERDFKIKTVYGGCGSESAMECYDQQMRQLLVSQLGDTFYYRAYVEARTKSR